MVQFNISTLLVLAASFMHTGRAQEIPKTRCDLVKTLPFYPVPGIALTGKWAVGFTHNCQAFGCPEIASRYHFPLTFEEGEEILIEDCRETTATITRALASVQLTANQLTAIIDAAIVFGVDELHVLILRLDSGEPDKRRVIDEELRKLGNRNGFPIVPLHLFIDALLVLSVEE